MFLFGELEKNSNNLNFFQELLELLKIFNLEIYGEETIHDFFIKLARNIQFEISLPVIRSVIKAMQIVIKYLAKPDINILNEIWEKLKLLMSNPLFQEIIPDLIVNFIKRTPEFAESITDLLENIINRAHESPITDSEIYLSYYLIKRCYGIEERKNCDGSQTIYSFTLPQIEMLYETLVDYTINVFANIKSFMVSNYQFTLCFKICYEILIVKGMEFEVYQQNLTNIIIEVCDFSLANKDSYKEYIIKISKALMPFILHALQYDNIFETIIGSVVEYLLSIDSDIFPNDTLNILEIIAGVDYSNYQMEIWKIFHSFCLEIHDYEFSVNYAIFFMTYGDEYIKTHSILDVSNILNHLYSCISKLFEAITETEWEDNFPNLLQIFYDLQG